MALGREIQHESAIEKKKKNFWEVRRYLANFRYVVCTLPRSPTCLHTARHLRSPGRPGLPSTETRERPSLRYCMELPANCLGAGLQSRLCSRNRGRHVSLVNISECNTESGLAGKMLDVVYTAPFALAKGDCAARLASLGVCRGRPKQQQHCLGEGRTASVSRFHLRLHESPIIGRYLQYCI